MSNVPSNLKYAASHEWVLRTPMARHHRHHRPRAGSPRRPRVSSNCRKSAPITPPKEIAVVESVKAAADVYAPIAGTVTEVNPRRRRCAGIGQRRRLRRLAVQDDPGQPADVDALLDAAAYQAVPTPPAEIRSALGGEPSTVSPPPDRSGNPLWDADAQLHSRPDSHMPPYPLLP